MLYFWVNSSETGLNTFTWRKFTFDGNHSVRWVKFVVTSKVSNVAVGKFELRSTIQFLDCRPALMDRDHLMSRTGPPRAIRRWSLSVGTKGLNWVACSTPEQEVLKIKICAGRVASAWEDIIVGRNMPNYAIILRSLVHHQRVGIKLSISHTASQVINNHHNVGRRTLPNFPTFSHSIQRNKKRNAASSEV